MAKNVHNVPKKMWAKWNAEEQAAFNRLWSHLQPMILPTGVSLNLRQFNVLRFNTCWTAAEMLRTYRGL